MKLLWGFAAKLRARTPNYANVMRKRSILNFYESLLSMFTDEKCAIFLILKKKQKKQTNNKTSSPINTDKMPVDMTAICSFESHSYMTLNVAKT